MVRSREVLAAGAVVVRKVAKGEWEVLLVHRPRYDDWSFPKGKLDRRESFAAAAVREVEEETGLRVRLGSPLGDQEYDVRGRPKRVRYWVARVIGSDEVDGYQPNREIDAVAWTPLDKARKRLSYDRDRATLEEAVEVRKRTRALVILRHGKARSRKSWVHDDRLRPLLAEGVEQAAALVPVLGAYDVTRLASSSSTRCVQTLTPYAASRGLPLELSHALSEEDATDDGVEDAVEELLESGESAVVCTHRPVLPAVFEALGLEGSRLDPAGMVVLHHRDGVPLRVEVR